MSFQDISKPAEVYSVENNPMIDNEVPKPSWCGPAGGGPGIRVA